MSARARFTRCFCPVLKRGAALIEKLAQAQQSAEVLQLGFGIVGETP